MVEEYKGRPYDVLILGGGLAGLTAAVSLIKSGLRPIILEAAKQPGGRARSFYDPHFDEILDCGPHLLIGAYSTTLNLLEVLGTRDLLLESATVNYQFWNRNHGWHSLGCPDWPAPLHLLAGVLRFAPLTLKDKLAAAVLATAFLAKRATLEEQSVTQWLHGYGQKGGIFEQLWAPLCLAALNEPAGSANAALFAEVMQQSFFTNRAAARPLLPTVPLSQLIGEPARAYIKENGGEYLAGQRVQKIIVSGDKITGITTARSHFSRPPAVISALPYGALAGILPDWAAKAGFSQLCSTPIVSVHLLYNKKAQLPAPLIGLPFETSQWLFDRGISKQNSNKSGGARLSGVMSGAYRESQWSKKKLIDSVAADIARLQPQLKPSQLSGARVIKERRATFSPWPQTSRLRPDAVTPWKNMVVAGDWTAG
ncbi:MAG: FAD-dependent oxidoreductase, partial [Magnetococcales bacterium]|nr:FAD-dependent oxidoreductase [Magnetococcales bacterium]